MKDVDQFNLACWLAVLLICWLLFRTITHTGFTPSVHEDYCQVLGPGGC